MWLPDLRGRSSTKYVALVEALAEAIERGELRPGDRLPTHRELAWRLGVNVSTVTQAYREAARRHLVGGEVGRGTFVLADSREAALFALKDAQRPELIDLSTNVPAPHPDDADVATLLGERLASGFGAGALGYHAPGLLARARAGASAWLAWRGHEVRPGDTVPCAGAQQALLAALVTLCGPEGCVLVEAFTFPGMKAVARQLRLRLHGVACDGAGVEPAALDAVARASGARVAVLVPNLQNPTGALTPEGRRREVAAVARRHDLTVIEDDVYGALTDLPPLAAALPERTIVIGGLSKAVAPGLRFGFAAGPAALVAPIAAEVHVTSWAMSPLTTGLVCAWIEDGTAARRAAWQRAEVAARWRMARAAFGARETGGSPAVPCPHFWSPTVGEPDDAAAPGAGGWCRGGAEPLVRSRAGPRAARATQPDRAADARAARLGTPAIA
jgi:DNA-binding transcriptional MocR family regulator